MSLVHFKMNETCGLLRERSAKIQIFIFQRQNFKISCFKKFISQRTDLHTFMVLRNLRLSYSRNSNFDDMTFIILPNLNCAHLLIHCRFLFFSIKKKSNTNQTQRKKMSEFYFFFFFIFFSRNRCRALVTNETLDIKLREKKSQVEPIPQFSQFLIARAREIRDRINRRVWNKVGRS